jgi:hypothetical protein
MICSITMNGRAHDWVHTNGCKRAREESLHGSAIFGFEFFAFRIGNHTIMNTSSEEWQSG